MSPLLIGLLGVLLLPLFVGSWRTSLLGLSGQGLLMAWIVYRKGPPPEDLSDWLTLGELVVLRGLTARRAAEMALYLKPDDEADTRRTMPQAVEAESSLAASPIAQGGAVSIGTGGVVTAMAAFGDQAKPVIDRAKEFAGTLGVTPLQALAGVLLIVGIVMVYQRYKQRSQGWA